MDFTIFPSYHISCLPPLSVSSLNNYVISSFPDFLSLYSFNSHIANIPLPAVSVVKMPNTKQIICSSESSLYIYNLEEFKEIRTFDFAAKIKSISTTNSPAIFLSGSKDGCLSIWDIRQKSASFSSNLHKKSINSIDSCNHTVVTGGAEGSLKVADMRKLLFEAVCCNESINDLSLSFTNDRVAVLHANSLLRIYNLNTFETIVTSACVNSYIVKDRPEGILVLSNRRLSLFNTRGLVVDKEANWTFPLCLSQNNKVVSRETGIDVWEIRPVSYKNSGIDFEKLNAIKETVNIRLTVESRAMSERSVATIQTRIDVNLDELAEGHKKTMVLLAKRSKALEELAELFEQGGAIKLFPKICKAELAVQAGIFSELFAKKKAEFVGIVNAANFLEICLRLAKSKNSYLADVAGKSTSVIIREISQDFFYTLTSGLAVNKTEQVVCVKIFKIIEEICSVMKGYKRGLAELNEIEYLIERLKAKVDSIELPKDDLFNFK